MEYGRPQDLGSKKDHGLALMEGYCLRSLGKTGSVDMNKKDCPEMGN